MCLHVGGVGSDGCGIYCAYRQEYSLIAQFPRCTAHIFSTVVKVVGSNQSKTHQAACHCHTTMAATKGPQCAAREVCEGRFGDLWGSSSRNKTF